MEPRKRNNPHTRKEWAAIRPALTNLYQTQGKKLSEVVEILGGQGFHAKPCHYKTYIKKWGLGKNNKQYDMVFTFQKLQERQGKETVFDINGQRRTRQDVEKYWKRREEGPEQFSPIADTPDHIYYYTPTPGGHANAVGAEADESVLSEHVLPSDAHQSTGPL